MTVIIDPKFPQISQVLTPHYMQQVLQNNLFSGNAEANYLTVEHCSVGERRHKPGKNFLLTYQLKLQNVLTKERTEQLLTARLYGIDREVPAVTNVIENKVIGETGVNPINYLPELRMIIWAFPHDDKLAHLPSLHDINFLRGYFNKQRTIAGLSAQESVVTVNYEIMHYLPEKSCMTRYLLSIRNTSQKQRKVIVYGKCYHDDSGWEIYKIMRSLAKQTPQYSSPLHYEETLNTLWQSHVPGKPLEWNADCLNIASSIGSCVAAFHSSELAIEKRYGFTDIFKQLHTCCELSLTLGKSYTHRINVLVQNILTSHSQINWKDATMTPLHLDLKMGNFLVDKEQAYLIDMDSVCLGDPLADIGSFIANVYLNSLRAHATLTEADLFISRFLETYQSIITWSVNKKMLNWYISAALIHEVLRRSMRQQDTERMQLAEQIMDVSEHYLKHLVN